jgi:cell filamentation protein
LSGGVYTADTDTAYCYPGTAVLKNRLGLTDPIQLEEFEIQASTLRAEQPLPRGRFTGRHYRAVHHHLFQDVYDWAGRTRTIRLGKGGNWFCYPEHIDRELDAAFADLKQMNFLRGLSPQGFCAEGARFLSRLNAIHAFREGNGRAQTLFFSMLAAHAGHPIDLSRLPPNLMLAAMIRAFGGDESPLENLIRALLA